MRKKGHLGQDGSSLLYLFHLPLFQLCKKHRHVSGFFKKKQAAFVFPIQFPILLVVPILSLLLHVYIQTTLSLDLHVQEIKTYMKMLNICGCECPRQYPLKTSG